MTVRLITLSLRQVLRLLLLTCRSSRSKDLELLVLRQELAVLRRQVPHPKTKREERLVLTVLQRLRPVHERLSSLFTPDTLRRWHRELVRRKWDGPHRINKRKTIPLRTQLIGHGRPTRATSGSPAPPFAPRELSVPAKERLWRDEEGAPAPSRQQPGEGGEAPDPQGDKRRAH